MHEHLIRLRGGWQLQGPGDPPPPPTRVTLPLAALPLGAERVKLVRDFQTPPLDPEVESLWLRLDAVPGLNSVALNGLEIAGGPFPTAPLTIPLGHGLPARNRLALDARPVEPAPAGRPWGEVALLIRRAEPGRPDG